MTAGALRDLAIADRETFDAHLRLRRHELSVYAFPAIYGWKKLFRIRWKMAGPSLCVFFTDALSTFLILPPLGERVEPRAVEECFREMDRLNRNPACSRIENIEEQDLAAFRGMGYTPVFKSHDYVYRTASLAGLRGDPYKAKRCLANRFARDNEFQCVPYSAGHRDGCLRLYRAWMAARAAKSSEHVYRGMLSDSLSCLEAVLDDLEGLGVSGLAVTVAGEVRGFTLGYPLTDDTFCVLFEVTDLALTGLSQFIFRGLCRERADFRLINAMDDSGLENLKRVKMSYRPCARPAAYIVNHNDH